MRRSFSGSRRLGLAAVLTLWALLAPAAAAHPIHTTMAELAFDARSGRIDVALRVFADDFQTAVTGNAGAAAAPRAMASYLSSRFVVVGADGKIIPLQWRGARATKEVILIRLQGHAPRGLRGSRLRNEIVFNVHADQVNIVKVRNGEREHTLLFTRNAPEKRLP